ncbi:MAG: membrane integrity-associated transporter subunit PqiC [Rhodoferax sp.]|jgi:cholesterol transport system auxiliary component|nr:membrane integrity-associated transporter subunit PqiC [Rhodoferax sp.]
MKYIAISAYLYWARGLFLVYFLALAGCTLPGTVGMPVVVYDFGPGAVTPSLTSHRPDLPPLELSSPQASVALNSLAVQYRLAYADAQALKPYALARWSMPPTQLIGQRLREQLSRRRAVVSPGEIVRSQSARQAAAAQARPAPLLNLRLDLEEFSQLFEAPDQSSGLLRLRATIMLRSAVGESLLAQRSFVVQQPALSADARGGVHALTAAADQALQQIELWLGEVETISTLKNSLSLPSAIFQPAKPVGHLFCCQRQPPVAETAPTR